MGASPRLSFAGNTVIFGAKVETKAGLYLISGGPGAGKSTLLTALCAAGFAGAAEVSRQLIREQVAGGGALVPWHDLAGFAELALDRMVQHHKAAVRRGGITFFDRGLPDLVAYLEAAGLPVGRHYYRALATHPYHRQALLAPPWPEIYVNDPERWQTLAEATALHQALQSTYQRLGFQVLELPRTTVLGRVAWVRATLVL